jgi:hypothetical protein
MNMFILCLFHQFIPEQSRRELQVEQHAWLAPAEYGYH